MILSKVYIQSRAKVYIWLLNKPYVNEATLTGQNQLLKCCLPVELFTKFEKGIDLSKCGVCRSKGCKVTCCQSWRSLEKVCHFGLYGQRVYSRTPVVESFSKFDGK